MKSYFQGMITGGVMVFATIVFMGQIKPIKLQNQYDPVEAQRQQQLEIQRRKEAKKKKKADAQKERVRTSQLKVDQQRLNNPIGKYNTGVTESNGKTVYWVTDTQTSFTYANIYDHETKKSTYWGFTYEHLKEKFKESN